MSKQDLNSLREQIRTVDDEIFTLLSKRIELAREVGKAKLDKNLPIKDYEVERRVLENAKRKAKQFDIYEDLATDISKTLIHYACRVQDEFFGKSKAVADTKKQKVLVVGGLGHMGQWMAEFFESFGHEVSLCDPAATDHPRFKIHSGIEAVAPKVDVIVLATPISVTEKLLDNFLNIDTQALILDICSLKSTLVERIERLIASGHRVASVHPMFGPDTQYLFGENIIVCEYSAHPEYADLATQLFASSSAEFIRIELSKHDQLIGYILGLSHLSNLIFGGTLATGPFEYEELKRIGSTTFNAQVAVTEKVAKENQGLYFEIQSLNSFSKEVIDSLKKTVDNYSDAVLSGKKEDFSNLMENAKRYFSGT